MSSVTVAYVYVLRCRTKVYVGSALNPTKRIHDHFKALQGQRHENSYLQRAWNKHGKDAFNSEVVAICAVKQRWVTEQQWIDRLNACDRKSGFNVMHSVKKLLPSKAMSEVLKAYWCKRWADPVWSKMKVGNLVEQLSRPEVKGKMSVAKINAWAALDYRMRLVAKHKEYAAREEVKARLSDQAKKAWNDPTYRAKQIAERKVRFADPEFKAKLSIAAQNRRSKITTHNEIV